MEKDLGCHVALAHDAEWMKHGTDKILMSLLDDELKAAARDRIPVQSVV